MRYILITLLWVAAIFDMICQNWSHASLCLVWIYIFCETEDNRSKFQSIQEQIDKLRNNNAS